jgi:hypothetical protein
MASITWPTTLPQYPELSGFKTTYQNQQLSSSMDAGPPKVRRRFTAGIINHTIMLTLNTTEFETFKTFFFTTCQSGTIRFDWSYFSGELRFSGMFEHSRITPSVNKVSFSLEELP